jgi:hypothetical protein
MGKLVLYLRVCVHKYTVCDYDNCDGSLRKLNLSRHVSRIVYLIFNWLYSLEIPISIALHTFVLRMSTPVSHKAEAAASSVPRHSRAHSNSPALSSSHFYAIDGCSLNGAVAKKGENY